MRFTISALSAAALTAVVSAQTYTFDAPNFAIGETTPMADRAPNIAGILPGFSASFTALVGSLAIQDTASFQPNSLFSGQYIYVPTAGALIITFNQSVTSVSFDFAVNGAESGFRLGLGSESFSHAFDAVDVGGGFYGGHVEWEYAFAPFTSIIIGGIAPNLTETQFAIDNLVITPTPGAAAALTVGGIASLRRRRR